MKKLYTLILLGATVVASHANQPKNDTLQLRNTHLEYRHEQTIDIALSFPQLYTTDKTSQTTQSFAAKMNADVCQTIASIAPASEFMLNDSLWRSAINPAHMELYLISAANASIADQQGYGGPKVYDLYSEWAAFGNEHLVSIFIKTYLFAGGAHGMNVGRILNYDTHTGNRIDLVKEIKDTAFLMDLAAVYFCKERRLPRNAITINTGLFYELADLPFPDQIGFTSKGMILYYDPYSIAPYSFGAIAITIPQKELDDILAESFFEMKVKAGGAKTYNERTKGKLKKK